MFERYTEKARRVIFFARYEASALGSPYIETEHLLLGLLRENRTTVSRFLSPEMVDEIRRQIEEATPPRENGSSSVDLPLSTDSKAALAFGTKESEGLGHKYISPAHLLAGLLRTENTLGAQLLRQRGVELEHIREWLKSEEAASADGAPKRDRPAVTSSDALLHLPAELLADITRQARANAVDRQTQVVELIRQGLRFAAGERSSGDFASRRETYHRLREVMQTEGAPALDEGGLEQEIARRKGVNAGS